MEMTCSFSDTILPLCTDGIIFGHFRRIANDHSKRVCVQENRLRSLTYGQCLILVNHLSFILQHRLDVKCGSRIGLYMSNSLEYIVSILAILKLKAIFLPLDTDHPVQRLKSIQKQSHLDIILTNNQKKIAKSCYSLFSIPMIQFQIMNDGDIIIDKIMHASSSKPVERHEGGYIIYTSGSTGYPKGILIEESGLYNMAMAQIDIFNIQHSDTVAQYASICFDASLSEIFMSLLAGASLFIFNSRNERAGPSLIRLLNSHLITVLTLPPCLLASLDPSMLPHLRILISAGEPCPKAVGYRWFRSGRRFFNAYGPSEAAVCTTVYELKSIESSELKDCETIPIGTPIHGMQIRVVDSQLQDVLQGLSGELLIGGRGVSKYGYINKTDPFVNRCFFMYNGKRWYRTGDIVKTIGSTEPLLVYVGRKDNQIKLNGCRIEMSEVEAVAFHCPGILYFVVVFHHCLQCSNDSSTLVAYFDGSIDASSIRKTLAENLPTYMLPTYIIKRSSCILPTTLSGKIDRKVLITDESIHVHATTTITLTKCEQYLLSLWKQVLSKQKSLPSEYVTNQITFAQCGGNSLTMALLHSLVSNTFFSNVPLQMHMSLQEMSQTILQRKTRPIYSSYKLIMQDLMIHLDFYRLSCPTPQCRMISSILMTGATGFVGCFLLNELLRTTSINIVVVVRAKTISDAHHRLRLTFQKYGLLDETMENIFNDAHQRRIELCLLTNVSDENSDVIDFTINCRWNSIDAILHCAADTNFNSTYENLRSINVIFTQYLINQCFQYNISLYYISSLSIFLFPDANRNQSSSFTVTETDKPVLESIIGGYGQSKYVADSLILRSLKQGLRGGIFRLGRVTGSSISGLGTTQDLFVLMLQGCHQLGAYPNLKFPFDLTPIDHVCKVIVNMIKHSETSTYSAPLIVHLINTHTISFDEQFVLLNEYGLSEDKTKELPYDQWCDRLENQILYQSSTSNKCNPLLPLLPFLRSSFWQNVDRWPIFIKTIHDEAVINIDPRLLFHRYCIEWKRIGLFECCKGGAARE